MSRNCLWDRNWGRAGQLYWPIFFLSPVTVPEVFAKVHSPQFPSFSKMGNLDTRRLRAGQTQKKYRKALRESIYEENLTRLEWIAYK